MKPKERILEVATELFHQRGYNTTIQGHKIDLQDFLCQF